MVQYIGKYKKEIAIDLRKNGASYSEIINYIKVPKSTVAFWLRDVKLSDIQIQKLKNKQLDAIKQNSKKRVNKTFQQIELIKKSSAEDIKNISNRELWLMGVILYWRERFAGQNETDQHKGVRFTSSDSYLIKLFLKWLVEIGKIGRNEIIFDIFLNESKKDSIEEIKKYWSRVTRFKIDCFQHQYFLKSYAQGNKKRIVSKKSEFGYLRIRVKSSSMLARQIAGWIKGIQKYC